MTRFETGSRSLRKVVLSAMAAGLISAAAGQAAAQSPRPVSADPQAVVKERESAMKSMGDAMKKISAYVKNEGGSIEGVREGAAAISQASHKIVPSLFPAATGIGNIEDSEAKPEIWQQWGRFEQAADRLVTASDGLSTASQGEDRAAIAKQFSQVGQACGGCHDDFRQKKS
ncbi:cytochrome c [Skermanella rosea]|uniref:c-type cytochrome n=1 Tax=Skermanella rosea TaxID=1817965 RepID=UPI001931E9A4|nr:cytochrome c [Skermanella rosea]UEM06295.1 cytochrome c [Skermanella rosea]